MAEIPFSIGTTPNPNSIRVGLSQALFLKPSTYTSAAQAGGNALVAALLGIPGVVQVFTLNNFISINKDPGADWASIEPRVAQALMTHLHG
jgi:hypothetical protein